MKMLCYVIINLRYYLPTKILVFDLWFGQRDVSTRRVFATPGTRRLDRFLICVLVSQRCKKPQRARQDERTCGSYVAIKRNNKRATRNGDISSRKLSRLVNRVTLVFGIIIPFHRIERRYCLYVIIHNLQ